MDSNAPLSRTPIEYYMLAAVLVVLNIAALVLTGHHLLTALSMGMFFGLFQAIILLLIVVTWRLVLGGGGQSETDTSE